MKIKVPLLKSVLSVQASSYDDAEMIAYIRSFAKNYKFKVMSDAFGNLYITKGKSKIGYPCVISHIDTVHEVLKDFKVFEHRGSLFAYTGNGCHQVGIGGDDKVGVYACLQFLLDLPTVKVVFFKQEEIGCQGSANADMSFFDDCNFVLQLDRREDTDFSISAAGVELSSPEFREQVKPFLKKWGFSEAKTTVTDVMKLKQRGLGVCAANISSGYYLPHSAREVVIIDDVDRAYNLAHDIITRLGSLNFVHKYTPPKFKPVLRGKYMPWVGPNSKLPAGTNVGGNEKDRFVNYKHFVKYPGVLFPFMYMIKTGKAIEYNYKYFYIPGKHLIFDRYADEWVTNTNKLKDIYKDFVIEDNGKEFVFSWHFFDWIDKSEARWLHQAKTWLLKNDLSRWEGLKNRGKTRRATHLSADVLTEKYGMPHQTHTTA